MIRLEGALTGHAQVLSLLLSLLGQFHIQLALVGFSHCFLQFLDQKGSAGAPVWVDPRLNLASICLVKELLITKLRLSMAQTR